MIWIFWHFSCVNHMQIVPPGCRWSARGAGQLSIKTTTKQKFWSSDEWKIQWILMKTMKTRTGPKFLVKQTKASRELNLAFQGPISRLFNLKRVKIEKWFSNFNPSHEVSIPRYFTTTDSQNHTATYDWMSKRTGIISTLGILFRQNKSFTKVHFAFDEWFYMMKNCV